MTSILLVIDLQNDFVQGTLGSTDAAAIVPKVADRIKSFQGTILFTRDTHGNDYLETQEGKNLPVPHCLKGGQGWQIIDELQPLPENSKIYDKPAFGSTALAMDLCRIHAEEGISEITLIGLCTDICVISNALLLKAFLPDVPICVDASCCAGVTQKSHETALSAMEACHVGILR